MNSCVEQYKKMLMKHLPCGRTARKRLVCRFDGILASFLEDNFSPSADELNSAFGTPEEMAQILMAEVSSQEQAQYRKELLVKRILIGILLTAFLVLTTYIYFYKEKPITITEEIISEGTQYVDPNTAEQGEE